MKNKSLKDHLREAGRAKSPAKTAASRENGKKGGRPPKENGKRQMFLRAYEALKKAPGLTVTRNGFAYIRVKPSTPAVLLICQIIKVEADFISEDDSIKILIK